MPLHERGSTAYVRAFGLVMLASTGVLAVGTAADVATPIVGVGLFVTGVACYVLTVWDDRLRPVSAGLVVSGMSMGVQPGGNPARSAALFLGAMGAGVLLSTHPWARRVGRWWADRTDPYVSALGRKLGYTIATIRARLGRGS